MKEKKKQLQFGEWVFSDLWKTKGKSFYVGEKIVQQCVGGAQQATEGLKIKNLPRESYGEREIR